VHVRAEGILPAHVGDPLSGAVESSDAPFPIDGEHGFIDRVQDGVGRRVVRDLLYS
jgi:hypothetical protein